MNGFVVFLSRCLRAWDKAYGALRNGLRFTFDQLRIGAYTLGPKSITSEGYAPYRNREIARAIDDRFFFIHRLPENYGRGLDERVIEYPWLFSRLKKESGRLLDAGSVLNFDALLRRPELSEKRVFISTLAPEPECAWWRNISYVYEDLRESCFRDGYFDWIVCLSTIEHVGMDTSVYAQESAPRGPESAMAFLAELHRMLKPGGTLYLSFPFGKKADLGWMQVFDAAAVDKMIQQFHPRMTLQSYFRHGAKGWKSCPPEAAADATYFEPRTTADNPHRTAAAEAVCLLELVK